MKCYICDREIPNPSYDHDHEDWAPCHVCQAEINELVSSYGDVPFTGTPEVSDAHECPKARPEMS